MVNILVVILNMILLNIFWYRKIFNSLFKQSFESNDYLWLLRVIQEEQGKRDSRGNKKLALAKKQTKLKDCSLAWRNNANEIFRISLDISNFKNFNLIYRKKFTVSRDRDSNYPLLSYYLSPLHSFNLCLLSP